MTADQREQHGAHEWVRCEAHGGEFYIGCMGICSQAPQGVSSCPMPREVRPRSSGCLDQYPFGTRWVACERRRGHRRAHRGRNGVHAITWKLVQR